MGWFCYLVCFGCVLGVCGCGWCSGGFRIRGVWGALVPHWCLFRRVLVVFVSRVWLFVLAFVWVFLGLFG